MSSKYAEHHEGKETVQCKICNGNFVPGGTRLEIPDRICIWCFTRGPLHRRFMLLWDGLESMALEHDPDCQCKGCKIYRAAFPIFNPPARIQESES